jgi:hypothetical protein
MKLAKDMDVKNNKNSEFYIWIDAGISRYRSEMPPNKLLNLKDVFSLPHDKFIYTFQDEVPTGTSFMIHKNFIDDFHDIYYKEMNDCYYNRNDYTCGVDQNIFKSLLNKYPNLFFEIGKGYGEIVPILLDKYC